jgi:hypothetical protein
MILLKEDYLCNCNEEFDLVKVRTESYKSLRAKFSKSFLEQETTNSDENQPKPVNLDLPSEGRQVFTRWHWSYPNRINLRSKTFFINYHKPLSTVDKILLNNFQKKYLYHAIDDILYSLKSKPRERDNLLAILYSPVIYLQNNFSIDFFDIWIDEISISKLSKGNKFLTNGHSNLEPFSSITIKLVYNKKLLAKKPESFW